MTMWHKGTIAEAIGKTKKEKTILLVFVEEENEDSEKMRQVFSDETVRLLCENSNFVCLKIKFESEPFKQFAQIYPCPSIPVTFLIGLGGKPLEILVGSCEVDEFIRRCYKAIEFHVKQFQEQTAAQPNVSAEIGIRPNSPNFDEKAKIAEELIAKRRAEKAAEQLETEKEKERRRREEGKELQKVLDTSKEREMQEIVDARKKERKGDKEALQRIRDQIKADRDEKQRKFQESQAVDQTEKEMKLRQKTKEELDKKLAEQAERSLTARIQFRIPDGAPITQNFEAMTIFGEVHRFIQGQIPYPKFQLLQMYPRREFTAVDFERTLRELQLAPTAVLLVLPEQSLVRRQSASGYAYFEYLVKLLLYPLTLLYTIIGGLFGGGGGSNRGGPSGESNRGGPSGGSSRAGPSGGSNRAGPSGVSNAAQRPSPRQEGGAQQRPIATREGNLTRLRNPLDDERSGDRDANWNGDSTELL